MARRLVQVLVTFHLVVLAWVFFRAEDLAQALRYLEGIASLRGVMREGAAVAAPSQAYFLAGALPPGAAPLAGAAP